MMLDKSGEPFETVRQQLAHATVARREFTGVGFYTDFTVVADAPVRRDLPNMEIGGVGAEFSGLQQGAGFVLFIRDGVVSMLEGFTYDEPWPERVNDFRVSRHKAA